MSKIQLSTKQKQVASHVEGALLVLASAGSGKPKELNNWPIIQNVKYWLLLSPIKQAKK